MRLLLALVLPLSFAAGCTPFIPVRDDFATSALVPAGAAPPEFVEFNNFDPSVNTLLAQQMCATPAIPLEQKGLGAAPGHLVEATSRCQTHVPILGP